MNSIRGGPTFSGGVIDTTREYEKARDEYRKAHTPKHRGKFNSDKEFNDWADFQYNYKILTGDDLGFLAPIQSEGVGGGIAKGGSSIARRLLPGLFRGVAGAAANFDGPILVTSPGSAYQTIIAGRPQAFGSLTPEQIRAYVFGKPHNTAAANIPEGEGTLADYIQHGGSLTNPELQPFLNLYESEARQADANLFQDAIKTPLPPEGADDFTETKQEQDFKQSTPASRTEIWSDMWRNNKRKPPGGQSKNGKWKREMDEILKGETIPDRASPEYNDWINKIKNKFYQTDRGEAHAPSSSSSSSSSQAPAQTPAQTPAQVPPSRAPVVKPIEAEPIESKNAPPAQEAPPREIPINRRPMQPNQPPIKAGGGGGPPYKPPSRGPPNFRTRKVDLPPIPKYPDGPPTDPKAPKRKPPEEEDPRRKPPDEKKPDEPQDPEDPQGVPEKPDEEKHKLISGSGYGYKRPEYSNNTGVETLILSDKERIHELTAWDRFDEVTDAIYTMDNPLYTRHVANDKERFSGIAKDPYLYLGEEYAKHNAPDEFKIYATQGVMVNSNNQMTALGQVARNPFDLAGPQERGEAFRTAAGYEDDILERLYENPDLLEQIQDNLNYVDNMPDINKLVKAVNSTHAITLANRWTTDTAVLTFDDAIINLKTMRNAL